MTVKKANGKKVATKVDYCRICGVPRTADTYHMVTDTFICVCSLDWRLSAMNDRIEAVADTASASCSAKVETIDTRVSRDFRAIWHRIPSVDSFFGRLRWLVTGK